MPQVATVAMPELPPAEPPHARIIERTGSDGTFSAIAHRLHLHRKTLRRFLHTGLDIHHHTLHGHRRQHPGTPSPRRDPRAGLSWQGRIQAIPRQFDALRDGIAEDVRADIPRPRKITSWIRCHREDLSTKDDEGLLQVRLP